MSNTVPRPLVRANQAVIVLSVALSILTNFYWILLLPITANLSGILFAKNYIILTARPFLKKKPSEYIQEDKSDLRFNQLLATAMLCASLLFWLAGNLALAIVFGAMVFVAASVALSGFCVGCFMRFQFNQWKYRRRLKRSAE